MTIILDLLRYSIPYLENPSFGVFEKSTNLLVSPIISTFRKTMSPKFSEEIGISSCPEIGSGLS